jgi:hypothetical protein
MDVVFRDRFLALQRLEMAAQQLACVTRRAKQREAGHASKRRAADRNRDRNRVGLVLRP